MRIVKNGRVVENVPLILSLLKDSSWCYAWVWVGTIAIVPMITYQIYEVWKVRRNIHELIRSLLGIFILAANATWMFDDFFGQHHFRGIAKWFFTIGFGIVALYILFSFRDTKEEVVMVRSEKIRARLFTHRHALRVREMRLRHNRSV